MVVQAIQYSRFGDEEVLDLVNIKSDSLKVNQVRIEGHGYWNASTFTICYDKRSSVHGSETFHI